VRWMRRERVETRREGARMSEPEDERAGGQAGGKKGEERVREEMEEANGKRRRKSRARNSRLRWEFSKLPDLLRSPFPSSVSHFSAPYSFAALCSAQLAAPRRGARSSINGSQRGKCMRARGRLCRFRVMRNLARASREVASLDRF